MLETIDLQGRWSLTDQVALAERDRSAKLQDSTYKSLAELSHESFSVYQLKLELELQSIYVSSTA